MTEDRSAWEPAEDERKAVRNALLESRPDLAGNEEALLFAEKRVVDWVTGQERELSLKQCSS